MSGTVIWWLALTFAQVPEVGLGERWRNEEAGIVNPAGTVARAPQAPEAVSRILAGDGGAEAWRLLARTLPADPGGPVDDGGSVPALLAWSVADSLDATLVEGRGFLARMGVQARHSWARLRTSAHVAWQGLSREARGASERFGWPLTWTLGVTGLLAVVGAGLMARGARRRRARAGGERRPARSPAPRASGVRQGWRRDRPARKPGAHAAPGFCRDAARLEARLRSRDAA